MSEGPDKTCPLDAAETVRRYFIENRARLLDVAAFLDRVDRSTGAEAAAQDFRIVALEKALAEVLRREPGRVERVLTILSDLSTEPLASAPKAQGAFGAVPRSCC
jgi:hypothetical protein